MRTIQPLYYYTALGREDAESMLIQTGVHGCFLVRASKSVEGASVLSVL